MSAAPGERYRVAHLDELERVPLAEGSDWRPVRRTLGVTAFGINAYTGLRPGDEVIEEHDETSPGAGGHEELYLVASGAAEFTIDGELIAATQGTLLLIEPGVMRAAVATAAETTVVVIGDEAGAAMPPSPFEYWYAAIPAHEAGDHERAYAITAEGLAHHPEHGALHYALACEAALAGRRAEALDHLRVAFANHPRAREMAAEDSDLDSLRGDPQYPA